MFKRPLSPEQSTSMMAISTLSDLISLMAKSTGNPLSIKTEDLVKSPGYTHTESSPGTYTTPEAVIETDDREQITDTTKTPYRWVGRVGYTMEDGRKNYCTGFLVSKNTIVTAGHCLS